VDDIGNVATVTVLEDLFYGADPREVPFDNELDVFSYGYALTCHKAQGSEWDRVVVIDETRSEGFRFIMGDLSLSEFTKRWLYTAVTRAKVRVDLMEVPA
jgi:exodeoxyribonuclease V